MNWNIADAKQHFSEVIRLCVESPQPVFNRSRPVAVVISAADYSAFEAWRSARDTPARLNIDDLFGGARQVVADLRSQRLEPPDRVDRPGADLGAPMAGKRGNA